MHFRIFINNIFGEQGALEFEQLNEQIIELALTLSKKGIYFDSIAFRNSIVSYTMEQLGLLYPETIFECFFQNMENNVFFIVNPMPNRYIKKGNKHLYNQFSVNYRIH